MAKTSWQSIYASAFAEPREVKDSFTSTSLGIDLGTDYNGFPCGTIIRIWGDEGTGKSTMCVRIAQAYMAKRSQHVFYLDYEGGLTKPIASKNKLDWSSPYFHYVEAAALTLKQGYDLCLKVAEDPEYERSLFIIDSFDAMRLSLEDEIGEGYAAKKIAYAADAYRQLLQPLYSSQSSLIQVHQAAANQGDNAKYQPYIVSGGVKTRHYLSVDVILKESDAIRVGDRMVGRVVRWIIDKNRYGTRLVAGAFKFTQQNNVGIDNASEAIEYGEELGLVLRSGTYYSVPMLTDTKFNGTAALCRYLYEDPSRLEQLEEEIKRVAEEKRKASRGD